MSAEAEQLIEEGQFTKAIPLVEEMLAVRMERSGAESLETARCLVTLGFLASNWGQEGDAVVFAEEALRILEHQVEPRAPATAQMLDLLSYVRFEGWQLDRAETYYQRTYDLAVKVYGLGHPETAKSLTNLGRLRKAQDRFSEARSYLEEGLAIVETALGKGVAETLLSKTTPG